MKKGKVSYRVLISWRNNCATAIVYRDTGTFTHKIGRVSWECVTEDRNVLASQGTLRASVIILEDQRKRGARPRIVPFPRM